MEQSRTLIDRDVAASWPAAIYTDVQRGHDVALSEFWFDVGPVLATSAIDGQPIARERWALAFDMDGQIVRARRMAAYSFQTIESWEADTETLAA